MAVKSNVAREIIIETAPRKTFAARLFISLNNEILKENEDLATNPDVKMTNGNYYVKYGWCRNRREEDRKFVIVSDLFSYHGRVRFYDWKDFCRMAKTDKEVRWIKENTTISEELFKIAKDHHWQNLPFSVDWVKYKNKLKEKDPNLKDTFLWIGEDDEQCS